MSLLNRLAQFLNWSSHGIALGLAIAIAFAVQLNIGQALDAARWIAHSQELRAHMEDALGATRTIQGTLSLFVVGGAPRFDADLAAAAVKVHADSVRMRELAAANPIQLANLQNLDGSLQAYFDFVNQVIDVRRVQGLEEARRTLIALGQAPLDRAVSDLNRIRAEELRLLEERKDSLSREVWETTLSLEAAAVLVLVLQAWAFIYARRDKRRREEARVALQQANDRLEARVNDRTAELAEANRELGRRTAVAQDYAERLQSLTRRLLRVQEQDRRAIALELHDQIGQQLAALKLNLSTFTQAHTRFAADKRLTDSLDIIETTMRQTRDLSLTLRPSALDRLGLIPTLKWYARNQAERSGCAVTLTADPLPDDLPPDVLTAAFRIVQEAVTNALRHGRPRRVDIILKREPGLLKISVCDNGNGFDVEHALAADYDHGGLGLAGMRERAELVEGKFAIDSEEGSGTTVRAELPVTAI